MKQQLIFEREIIMKKLICSICVLGISTLTNASQPQLLTTASIKVSNVSSADPALTDADCLKMTDAGLTDLKVMENNGVRGAVTKHGSNLVEDYTSTTFDHGLYSVDARYTFHFERDKKPIINFVYVKGTKLSSSDDLSGVFSVVDSVTENTQCRGDVTIHYN